MRAAMAQRCFNPAGGRLSSLSMLRIPWETSWAALQPLVLQHEAVPWAGGTVAPPNPPGSLFPGAQPQSGPPSSSHAASLGVGAASLWGQVWHRGGRWYVWGTRGPSSFSPGHTPYFWKSWMRAGLENIPKELSGAGREAQALPQTVGTRVCVVWGVCVCVVSWPGANPAFG